MPYVGEIKAFAHANPVAGWLPCDGQTVDAADYPSLFATLGTTYGGNGSTSFALPDMRGRVPVHRSVQYPSASAGGAETHTLTVAELPTHRHRARASSATANAVSPSNTVWASTAGPRAIYTNEPYNTYMAPNALPAVGEGQPHNNMQPYTVLHYRIYTGEV